MRSAKQATRTNWHGDLWSESLAWFFRGYFDPGDSLGDVQESLEDMLENIRELIDSHGEDALVRQFLDEPGQGRRGR